MPNFFKSNQNPQEIYFILDSSSERRPMVAILVPKTAMLTLPVLLPENHRIF
jgi:hypothetical protein